MKLKKQAHSGKRMPALVEPSKINPTNSMLNEVNIDCQAFNVKKLEQFLSTMPSDLGMTPSYESGKREKGWNKSPYNASTINLSSQYVIGAAFVTTNVDRYIIFDADSKEAVSVSNILTENIPTLTWQGTPGRECRIYKLSEKQFNYAVNNDIKKFIIESIGLIETPDSGPLEVKFIGSANTPFSTHTKSNSVYKLLNNVSIAELPDNLMDHIWSFSSTTNNTTTNSSTYSSKKYNSTCSDWGKTFIDFLSNISVKELYGAYGVKNFREYADHIKGKNPFHISNSDRDNSFVMFNNFKGWFDFKTGIGGNILEFVKRINNKKEGNSNSKVKPSEVKSLIRQIMKRFGACDDEELGDNYDALKVLTEKVKVSSIEEAKHVANNFRKLNNDVVILLKAPMGSGKTQVFAKSQLLSGQTTILTPMICLGRQTCQFLKAKWHDNVKGDGDIEYNFGSTIDSINKYSSRIPGGNVLIDEVNSFASHLCRSNTQVSKKRDIVFRAIEKLGRKSNNIICLDAYLDDKTVKFITQLFPNKAQLIIEVEMESKVRNLEIYGKEEELIDSLMIELAAPSPKLIYASDSVKRCEAIYKRGIERLQELGVDNPESHILNINSKTTDSPKIKEILGDINVYLKANDIKLIVYSPSIKSGVSIQDSRYNTTFAQFFGVVIPQDTVQMINRSRALENLHLAIKEPKAELVFTPEQHMKHILSFSVADSNDIEFLMCTRKLFGDQHAENLGWSEDEVTDFLINMPNSKLKTNRMMEFYCEDKFTEQYEKSHYGELVIKLLKQENFNVRPHISTHSEVQIKVEADALEKNKEEFDLEICELVKTGMLARIDEVSETPEGLKDEMDRMFEGYSKDKMENGYFIQKVFNKHIFTIPEINEFVVKDASYLNRVRTGFMCLNKRARIDYQVNKLKNKMLNSEDKEDSSFAGDYYSVNAIYQALSKIGLIKALPGLKSRWYDKSSTVVRDVLKAYKKHESELKLILNVNTNHQDIKVFNQLLSKMGVPIIMKKHRNSREYKVATLADTEYFESTPEIQLYYSLIDSLGKRRYRASEITVNEDDFEFWRAASFQYLERQFSNRQIKTDVYKIELDKITRTTYPAFKKQFEYLSP